MQIVVEQMWQEAETLELVVVVAVASLEVVVVVPGLWAGVEIAAVVLVEGPPEQLLLAGPLQLRL